MTLICAENPIRLETMGNLVFGTLKSWFINSAQPASCFFGWKVSVKIDASQRFHANLCLVIDVSGSMQLPAALKDREAILGFPDESAGLGILYISYIYIHIICVSYILDLPPATQDSSGNWRFSSRFPDPKNLAKSWWLGSNNQTYYQTIRERNKWAMMKTLLTFHYTGWLIGILILAYCNHHIVG